MTSVDEQLRRSAAHLFVTDLGVPVVDDQDRAHLTKVLRLRDGEPVTLSDGQGSWCTARFRRAQGTVEVDGAVRTVAAPGEILMVGFAVPKGDRPEMIVRALTELGLDRIVPLVTARSVVRWDEDRARARHQRLERVAREAAMQSRRLRLPHIDALTTLDALMADGPGLADGRGPRPAESPAESVALAEPGGGPIRDAITGVLIGPEGGWDPEELDRVPDRLWLGPGVLRCETAAIAAGVLLVHQHRRSPATGD